MPILGLHTKKELAAAIEEAVKAAAPRHLLLGSGPDRWDMPDMSTFREQAELFRRLPALSTAVEMLVDGAALIDVDVYSVTDDEEKDIPNHPLEGLLKAPNPLQSAIEFWGETIGHRVLSGNCYWWYNKTNAKAQPDEVFVIPPDKIQPVPDERLYLRGYIYDTGDGRRMPLEAWEVEHFKRFNPFNRFVGLSVLEALAVIAEGDVKATEWNTKLFAKNNARLPGILSFADPINDTDWERLKKEFKDAADKREQIMLRGTGQGGIDWKQSTGTQREMEFLEGRMFTKREVWDAIAPGLSSMLDPSATEASSKTGEQVFRNFALYTRVIKPIESKLNRKDRSLVNPGLVQVYGDNLKLCFEDFRVSDRAMELQERSYYDAVHTVAEIRMEKYGDEPLGDERDNLFPAEIKAGVIKQQEQLATQPVQNDPQPVQQQEPQDEQPQGKAYVADLIKWRDKARKRGAGKVTEYESDTIPAAVKAAILAELPTTKTGNDIKILFARHMHEEPKSDIAPLVMLLEAALKANE